MYVPHYILQEGLIPGESKAEARSNITDSQIDNIQFEHTISGSSAVHLNHHNVILATV